MNSAKDVIAMWVFGMVMSVAINGAIALVDPMPDDPTGRRNLKWFALTMCWSAMCWTTAAYYEYRKLRAKEAKR